MNQQNQDLTRTAQQTGDLAENQPGAVGPSSARMAQPSSGVLELSVVNRVARLARLAPAPDEQLALQHELGEILAHFNQLAAIDTGGVEPIYHPQELTGQMRQDQPGCSMDRSELLAAADRQKDGCLIVPRTVE